MNKRRERKGLVEKLLEAADGNYNTVEELLRMCRDAAECIESLRKDLRDIAAKVDVHKS